ncbi:MAG: serine/threonine protein kinase [Myxococcales bacterium]|nr:serine/threonine protein kinase [Myxococcales bacterium]
MTVSPSPSESRPGGRLFGSKYKLVRKLGEGGMGVVYQVVKPPHIQGVLKRMNPDLARHEAFVKMFLDEVSILAQLEHPNIVRVYDFDRGDDGVPFYVMELLVGQNLRDVLDAKGVLPPHVAFEIARQLLSALHCAHTHDTPVVHRDVKPENIFLHTPRHGPPVVKLIDFGVIAFADGRSEGTFSGTVRYAAPEQLRAQAAAPKSDLYAAGLVLYEMLAGASPFEHHAHDDQRLADAQLSEEPAPLGEVAPWIPAPVAALVMRAIHKDPAARPPDAKAFCDELVALGAVRRVAEGHSPWEDRQAALLRARSGRVRPRLVTLWPEIVAGLAAGGATLLALHALARR